MFKNKFFFLLLSCLFSSLCHADWTTSPPQLISPIYSFTYGSVITACDPTNDTFLATWADGNNNQSPTYSIYTPNTGWSPFATISNTSSATISTNVFTSCNSISRQFIATWTDSTTANPTSSVFTPGLGWSSIDSLTTSKAAVNTINSFDSNAERFLVTWADTQNNNYPTYAFYTPNLGWGTVATISTTSQAANIYTTFNSTNDQFLAVWVDIDTGQPMHSFYNAGSWSVAAPISTLSNVDNDVICAYNPLTGHFIATWADINQNLYPFYSIYTGDAWSPINTITTSSGVTDNVTVSCDLSTGEFLAAWSNVLNGNPTYSFYTEGAGWSTPGVISTLSSTGSDVFTSFNSTTGEFLAAWSDRSNPNLLFDPTYSFFTFIPPTPLTPPPPTSFSGQVLKNRFLTQTDIIHELVWTPPTDASAVVSYQITRNGSVIAVISASGPFVYYDHNRNKHQTDVYTIVSVNVDQTPSTFLSVSL